MFVEIILRNVKTFNQLLSSFGKMFQFIDVFNCMTFRLLNFYNTYSIFYFLEFMFWISLDFYSFLFLAKFACKYQL